MTHPEPPSTHGPSEHPGAADLTDRIVAVAATFRPEVAATEALLAAVAPQVTTVLVMDNGSGDEALAALRAAAERVTNQGTTPVRVVDLGANLGIAAAQNRGVQLAREADATHVLLLDQDSLPEPDMVARLRAGLARAEELVATGRARTAHAADGRTHRARGVAAVGPVTRDSRQPDAPLLFHDELWGPRRAPLPARDGELVPVTFLLASGCLVPMRALKTVGPMNEAWFIDHIDLEWGLRATAAGQAMFGVAGAVLHHHLGDATRRLPGRAREVHLHSPIRNYYMTRNTILLAFGTLMQPRWRVGYLAWIVKYAGFYMLLQPPRAERIRELAAGLRDGLTRRVGPRRPGPPRRFRRRLTRSLMAGPAPDVSCRSVPNGV